MRLVEMKSLSGVVLCAAVASMPLFAGAQGRFSRVGLDEIRLGGEFERRIMMAVTNNLLKAEIEHQFLDHFRAKARSGDSVGTGKLIETAVRFGVYTGDYGQHNEYAWAARSPDILRFLLPVTEEFNPLLPRDLVLRGTSIVVPVYPFATTELLRSEALPVKDPVSVLDATTDRPWRTDTYDSPSAGFYFLRATP